MRQAQLPESRASAHHSRGALSWRAQVEALRDGFTPANALDMVQRYDFIVDASDNAPTRYLASDACAVARKPLVSGAAIGLEGQLTVYCSREGKPGTS